MSNKKRSTCFLTAACAALVMFSSYCYAGSQTIEITVRYNEKGEFIPKFQLPGEPHTQYTLTTKGMRKVGTQALITDWERYLMDDDTAPSTVALVRARCLPSSIRDATDMIPPGGSYAGIQLVCKKGEGILVLMSSPPNQDYEYVADLTITHDDEVEQNLTESAEVGAHDHISMQAPAKILVTPKVMPRSQGSSSCELM